MASPAGYMNSIELSVEEIPLGSTRLKEFVRFPWKLYRGDPCWTPPLNADYLGNRLLGFKGLLTPQHPYHRHAEVTHFMAWRGKEPVGRVAAAVNHEFNEYHHTSIGSFGLFEVVEDYEVARLLLDRVRDWVAGRGLAVLRGPGEYSNSTHERQGVLIDGFDKAPTVETTHNPPYYGEFLERYGFRKAKDYLGFIVHRDWANLALIKRFGRLSPKSGVTTRPLVMKRLREEIRLVVNIYNEAWAQNWGFLPISDEEGDAIADSLRMILDPDLIRFAYVNGEPAAVMGIIPDPNWALRPRWRWYGDSDLVRIARILLMRRRIPRTRGMFFGIRPQYRKESISPLLANDIASVILRKNYTEFEGSLVLEDNDAIIKVATTFGCQVYKRWRIYDLPLQ